MTRVASADEVRAVLAAFVSRMTAASMARSAADRAGLGSSRFERLGPDAATLAELGRGVALFVPEARRAECLAKLRTLAASQLEAPPSPAAGGPAAQEVQVRDENGIVDARTRARGLATELGFPTTQQVKIATAVSELSRNMFRYAGGGVVRLAVITAPRTGIAIEAIDQGPGIASLDHVLSGAYRSRTGLGKGLLGCKRIMDEFAVESGPGRGTKVSVRKYL